MAPISDSDQHKRKRNDDEGGGQTGHAERIPQPPPPQSDHPIPINYLSRAHSAKLRLIHGDGDTFSEVLALITHYEGVLNRHESLASNLGAKLTGPRLLKAMEGAFEGSITVNPSPGHFPSEPVTWLDVVEFAKSSPDDFVLSTATQGNRCCQFTLKGMQVEITEDDWRLIVSGALDRFKLVPPQPLEEDETAELATLDILEQRLQVVIKKADEVARKARQLNYHLSGRRAAVHGRRPPPQAATSSSGFQAVNQPGRSPSVNAGYDLHADLLQQFMATSQTPAARLSSISSISPTPGSHPTGSSTPRMSVQQQVLTSLSGRPSPSFHFEPAHRDLEEENRGLVTARVEKLARGDEIHPPCDRCRRLRTTCIKHLTACQGCTKKHARCVWKGLTEEEVTWLKGQMAEGEDDGDESRDPVADPSSAPPPGSQPDPAPASTLEAGRDSDRSDDAEARKSPVASRVAVGRHADDMWRKGSPVAPRHDSMEIDVDPRDAEETGDQQGWGADRQSDREGRSRKHVLLSHVASAATAAADAASSASAAPGPATSQRAGFTGGGP